MALFVVTGGAGFIGSHLTDALLAAGHAVRVLDDLSTGHAANLPSAATLITADVADPAALQAAIHGADGCFHLAAIASVARSVADWPGTHRVNAGGTVAVLDAARANGRLPVVYASSAAVYGDVGQRAATEALRPAPATAYGADKLASELHAHVGATVHALPSTGLRFFNVYGPRQDAASPYSGVISLFARRIADGEPITLHGDGEQTRDFIAVADVVAHLQAAMARLLAAETPQASVFNVCTGRAVSVRTLAGLLGELLGRNPTLLPAPARPGDIRYSCGDPALATARLGLAARTPLPDGLATLLQTQ